MCRDQNHHKGDVKQVRIHEWSTWLHRQVRNLDLQHRQCTDNDHDRNRYHSAAIDGSFHRKRVIGTVGDSHREHRYRHAHFASAAKPVPLFRSEFHYPLDRDGTNSCHKLRARAHRWYPADNCMRHVYHHRPRAQSLRMERGLQQAALVHAGQYFPLPVARAEHRRCGDDRRKHNRRAQSESAVRRQSFVLYHDGMEHALFECIELGWCLVRANGQHSYLYTSEHPGELSEYLLRQLRNVRYVRCSILLHRI